MKPLTELTPEALCDRVRNKIRCLASHSRDAVVTSLISLYRVDVTGLFSESAKPAPPPDSEYRPPLPKSGILDDDAFRCLGTVVKMFTSIEPWLVTKIIRTMSLWIDLNPAYFQRTFPHPSFSTESTTGSPPDPSDMTFLNPSGSQPEADPQPIPSASEQIANIGAAAPTKNKRGKQKKEAVLTPADGGEDFLNDMFLDADDDVPLSAIQVPVAAVVAEVAAVIAEIEAEPVVLSPGLVVAPVPPKFVAEEVPADDEPEVDPFSGVPLHESAESSDDPFNV
jgi:hypothetical protein